MNIIFLLGRLTKDPDVRYTPTGRIVTSFVLAVDRPFANQAGEREADFINCVIWGKPAETLGNTVSKGQRLMIEGRLQIRSYDGKDGQKHWMTEVVVANFEYIEKKNTNTNSEPKNSSYNQPEALSPMSQLGSQVPFDTEIPF